MATSCVWCGCFNGSRIGAQYLAGYQPDPEDFERARRAHELLALVVAQHDGEMKVEHRDYEEMRALLAESYAR